MRWLDYFWTAGGSDWCIDAKCLPLVHHWHGIDLLIVFQLALCLAVACAAGAGALYLLQRRRTAYGIFALALTFGTAAYAANSRLSDLSASGALAGANLTYVVQTPGSGGVKGTLTQVATYINSLFSNDFTCTSGGSCTLVNTGPGNTGPIGSATVTPVITIDAEGRVTALTSASISGGGAGIPHVTYTTGTYVALFGPTAGTTATASVNNRISCLFGGALDKATVSGIAVQSTTVGSNANFSMALYKPAITGTVGRPGVLIGTTVNQAQTSGNPAAVNVAMAVNKQIGPGGTDGDAAIWLCFNDDVAITLRNTSVTGGLEAALLGSATITNLTNNTTQTTFVTCTGAACEGGSSTFSTTPATAWPADLSTSTWTDGTGATMPYPLLSFASVP